MASDIRTAVGRWAASTGTGLQELTIGGLGWTPKAALFFSANATANGVLRDTLGHAFGCIGPDGVGGYNENLLSGGDQDSQASVNADNFYRSDACVGFLYYSGATAIEAHATGNGDGSPGSPGPIANGWRLDWAAAPDQAYYIVGVFFGGDDLQAHCGTFQIPATLDGTEDVTDAGFPPSLVCFFSNFNQAAPPASSTNRRMLFGVAADGSPAGQAGVSWRSSNGSGSGAVSSHIADDSVGKELGASEAFYAGEISFLSTGFRFTQRDSDGGGNADYWNYLALDTGDRSVWAGVVDGPTSTSSDWTVAAPGFTPQLGGIVATTMVAAGTFYNSGLDPESMSCGLFDADSAFCAGVVVDEGAATTDTASISQDATVRTFQGDQTAVHTLTGKPSFTASGWSVPAAQIDAADSTARKWVAWAIEAAAAETVTASASLDSAVQTQASLAGSLTAALEARQSVTAQGDAALRALMALAGELDAALRHALAAQAGLDGALASETVRSVTADAALRRALSVGVGIAGALQAERGKSAALDALLTVLQGGAAGLDAALAAVGSGELTLDAALSLLRERDAGLDAALRRLRSAAGSLDAALTAGQVMNASLQTALRKAMVLTAVLEVVVRRADLILKSDLDGVLRVTRALSASLQGVLQQAASLSSGLSGALQVSAEPLTGSLQAALTRTATLVATLSATVQLMRSLAAGLNAALQERAALSSLLDAVVGTPPAAYAPRGTRGQPVEARDRAIVGPDNRIILVPANPRRH